ncbi:MAG: hypothetical protein ACI8RD_013084 [Bacillariaceae sp.]|jgi:hypothetical protein
METTSESSFRRALSFIWKIDEKNDAPLVTTTATDTTTTSNNDTGRNKDPTNNKPSLNQPLAVAVAVVALQKQQQKPNLAISRPSDGNEDNKNKKGRTAADLWERYDLTEGINSRDMWELETVEKQVYKRPKLVPYSGINTVVD